MRLPTKRFLPRVDWEKSIELIRHGIDKGINYIDTAWPYGFGASEKIIGEALKDGYRERVFLVTKLFMTFIRKNEDFNKNHFDTQRNYGCESSLCFICHF